MSTDTHAYAVLGSQCDYDTARGISAIARRTLRDLDVRWSVRFGQVCRVPKGLQQYDQVAVDIKNEFKACLFNHLFHADGADLSELLPLWDELAQRYARQLQREIRNYRALISTSDWDEDPILRAALARHWLNWVVADLTPQRLAVDEVIGWKVEFLQDLVYQAQGGLLATQTLRDEMMEYQAMADDI